MPNDNCFFAQQKVFMSLGNLIVNVTVYLHLKFRGGFQTQSRLKMCVEVFCLRSKSVNLNVGNDMKSFFLEPKN